MSMTLGKLWIPFTIAQRLWQSIKRNTNCEKFPSGIFSWTKKAARCRENNVVATTPLFGGLQHKSQLQVG
jgi:hypothetical protein